MKEGWEKRIVKHDPSLGNPDIAVSLDQQMFPAIEPLIKKYAAEHDLDIDVTYGTCGISSGLLSRKKIDIGGFCCAPGMTDRLPGLRFHTIGIAALALIVNTENPINNITIEQARNIFRGDIRRWSELKTDGKGPGANAPVQPVGRLHCKLRPGHWRLLLDNEDLFSPGIEEVGAIPDMIMQVSMNERAIGFETLWMTRRFQHQGRVKPLMINGFDPDVPSYLISGKYPLYRVYNLTTWEGENVENEHAGELVDYLIKKAGDIEKKYSLVPAAHLRRAGWKFIGDELIGGPE